MAQFASDAFSGSHGHELSFYNSAWTKHPSYSDDCVIRNSRVAKNGFGSTAYYHSGAPASADYTVSADLFAKETDAGSTGAGVIGRVSTSANTFYMARYEGGSTDGWQLYKCVAGSFTQLGSTSAQGFTDETSKNVKLEMIGAAIKLFKEGSGTATITGSDPDITAAGKAGIRMGGNMGDDTGLHVDNFSADDAAAPATYAPPPRRGGPSFNNLLMV